MVAGVIPGTPIPEYSKQWSYNNDDYENDVVSYDGGETPSILDRYLKEAHDYSISITQPRYVNWVRLEWIWI